MTKLLLAEDDVDFASSIRDWLEVDHYAVEHVTSGKDALQLIRLEGFDLAVLDWKLPDITGVEVCQSLRKEGNRIPVIILTGSKTTLEDHVGGLDCGADDYITKPVDPKVLLSRLRALLRRSAKSATGLLTVKNISLNPQTHIVSVNGTKVHLYAREFSLLEFLMRNVDCVFSADQLVSRVWTSNEEVDDQAVRACVMRLRKKIDVDAADSVIKSIYGVGYTIKSE